MEDVKLTIGVKTTLFKLYLGVMALLCYAVVSKWVSHIEFNEMVQIVGFGYVFARTCLKFHRGYIVGALSKGGVISEFIVFVVSCACAIFSKVAGGIGGREMVMFVVVSYGWYSLAEGVRKLKPPVQMVKRF